MGAGGVGLIDGELTTYPYGDALIVSPSAEGDYLKITFDHAMAATGFLPSNGYFDGPRARLSVQLLNAGTLVYSDDVNAAAYTTPKTFIGYSGVGQFDEIRVNFVGYYPGSAFLVDNLYYGGSPGALQPVPEPATALQALMGLALLGGALSFKRKHL